MRRQPYSRLLLFALLSLICLGAYDVLLGQGSTTAPPEILSAVAVVLDRHGCEPREIAFPAGTNLLEVLNRTGFDTITYHIRSTAQGAGTASTTLLDNTLPGRTSRAYRFLKLSPGSYQMTLDNGARWTCPITVN